MLFHIGLLPVTMLFLQQDDAIYRILCCVKSSYLDLRLCFSEMAEFTEVTDVRTLLWVEYFLNFNASELYCHPNRFFYTVYARIDPLVC